MRTFHLTNAIDSLNNLMHFVIVMYVIKYTYINYVSIYAHSCTCTVTALIELYS